MVRTADIVMSDMTNLQVDLSYRNKSSVSKVVTVTVFFPLAVAVFITSTICLPLRHGQELDFLKGNSPTATLSQVSKTL
jgi:hypothetical protein